MRALGAEVIGGEDFDAAKGIARAEAARRGVRFVEDSRDPEPTEGAGTIGLEWLEFPERLDALLVALGNGAMLAGIATVIKGRMPGTRVIAVGATGAPAMVESLRCGRMVTHERIATIADGIGVRVPVPEAPADLAGLVDDFILVPDALTPRAMRLLHRHAGLVAEPSGAVGLAGIMQERERFQGQTVGTVICGGNLTPEQMRAWLAESVTTKGAASRPSAGESGVRTGAGLSRTRATPAPPGAPIPDGPAFTELVTGPPRARTAATCAPAGRPRRRRRAGSGVARSRRGRRS